MMRIRRVGSPAQNHHSPCASGTKKPLYWTGTCGDTREKPGRRGAATIVALLVLLVLAGMIGQYVRRVLVERRQFRNEALHQQAEKLADAGWQLATVAWQKDPAWSGVVWNVPPGRIHQTNSGEVVIRMQGETCTVTARYPTNLPLPFQVTRTRKLTP